MGTVGQKFFRGLDNFFKFVPVASTVTSLVDLFEKHIVFRKIEANKTNNLYIQHIKNQSSWASVGLLIPVLGNLGYAIYKIVVYFKKKEEPKDEEVNKVEGEGNVVIKDEEVNKVEGEGEGEGNVVIKDEIKLEDANEEQEDLIKLDDDKDDLIFEENESNISIHENKENLTDNDEDNSFLYGEDKDDEFLTNLYKELAIIDEDYKEFQENKTSTENQNKAPSTNNPIEQINQNIIQEIKIEEKKEAEEYSPEFKLLLEVNQDNFNTYIQNLNSNKLDELFNENQTDKQESLITKKEQEFKKIIGQENMPKMFLPRVLYVKLFEIKNENYSEEFKEFLDIGQKIAEQEIAKEEYLTELEKGYIKGLTIEKLNKLFGPSEIMKQGLAVQIKNKKLTELYSILMEAQQELGMKETPQKLESGALLKYVEEKIQYRQEKELYKNNMGLISAMETLLNKHEKDEKKIEEQKTTAIQNQTFFGSNLIHIAIRQDVVKELKVEGQTKIKELEESLSNKGFFNFSDKRKVRQELKEFTTQHKEKIKEILKEEALEAENLLKSTNWGKDEDLSEEDISIDPKTLSGIHPIAREIIKNEEQFVSKMNAFSGFLLKVQENMPKDIFIEVLNKENKKIKVTLEGTITQMIKINTKLIKANTQLIKTLKSEDNLSWKSLLEGFEPSLAKNIVANMILFEEQSERLIKFAINNKDNLQIKNGVEIFIQEFQGNLPGIGLGTKESFESTVRNFCIAPPQHALRYGLIFKSLAEVAKKRHEETHPTLIAATERRLRAFNLLSAIFNILKGARQN